MVASSEHEHHPRNALGDTSGVLSPQFKFSRRETGENDVTLKVLYCGICHSDLHMVKINEWDISTYPHVVPGHEIAGEVTEVGSKVQEFKVGDKVGVGCLVGSCKSFGSCANHLENYCFKSLGMDSVQRRVIGPWSPEEDDLLRNLVQLHGARNWNMKSKSIPGRSGKACHLRWYNHLSPEVEHRPFTVEEDEIIEAAHAKYGNKWSTIARLLNGRRSDNAIKNYWKKRKFSSVDNGDTENHLQLRPEKKAATVLVPPPLPSEPESSTLLTT